MSSMTPACFNAATVSPPPATERNLPAFVAAATACARDTVAASNGGVSNAPKGPFHTSVRNFTYLFACGVLVGFGTRYAGGCTSGHAITGLSTLQLPSLYAVIGIFSGGLISSWFLVPWMLL